MTPMKKTLHSLLVTAVALLACSPAARAASYTYSNTTGGSTNWNAGTNWNAIPVSGTDTSLVLTGTLAAATTITANDDISGNFKLNNLKLSYTTNTVGASPVVTISGNTLEFANNGATAPVLQNLAVTGTTGGGKATLVISNNIQLDNDLTLSMGGGGNTLSGVISGGGGLNMVDTSAFNGTGLLTLSNANTYTGATTVSHGTMTVSGAGSIASSSGYTIGGQGGATLLLDYTANATLNRLNTSGTVSLQGAGTLSFNGNPTAGTTTDAMGALAFKSGLGTVIMTQTGASGVETITAASISRTNNATGLIAGTSLAGSGSATRLMLTDTAGLAQVGADNTTKNVKIAPWLIGDATSGGPGTSFLTYDATLGLRLLSTATEYSTYAAASAGDNVIVSSTTTSAATATVNSLLISKNLTGTGGGGNVLTVSSGAILSTASGQTAISGFDGITLGNNEGIISTVSSTGTTTISSPITINNGSGSGGALTKAGAGKLVLGVNNTYTGLTTINGGLLQVGDGGSTGNLGTTSGVVISGNNTGIVFNTTSPLTLSVPITGLNNVVASITRASTSTGALTLGSVTGISTLTDNSTNGASAPTTMNQSGAGNTIATINGASGSVVEFTSSNGTGSTTIANPMNTAGQTVKITSGTVNMTSSVPLATTNVTNLYVNGGALVLSSNYGGSLGTASGVSLTLTGGTMSTAAQTLNYNATGSNTALSINQSGGLFTGLTALVLGGATGSSVSTYNLSGGTLNIGSNLLRMAADTGGAGTSTFNFSGGKLVVGGAGGIVGLNITGAKQAFVWTGGTLVTPLYNATNLTSTSGSAVGATTNTLTNGGGILAPGDTGSGGLTAITGNYSVTNPNAVYAVEIGSGTAGTATYSVGKYDNTTVSGTTTLGGRLSFSTINSYTPANDVSTLYKVLTGVTAATSVVSGSFVNQMTATSGNSRVVGSDGLSSFLVAINNTATAATTGGLTSVGARTVALGGYQAANAYNAASGNAWDSANAASWTNFDPGATVTPSTQASGAVAQFADGATGSGANAVTLNSTRNIQGVQFASTTAGHNYTIAGSGTMILDNTSNAAAATIADSSVSGNANAINVPIILNSNLALSVTNAANVLTFGGAIGQTAAGSTLTKTGAGTAILAGANTYTGATTVSAGKLLVTGALNGTTVVNGGTLGGNGSTLGITINSGGTLAAGLDAANTTAGTITANGNVSFASGSAHLAIRLGETTATDGDKLATAAGSALAVSLNGADLQLTLGSAYVHPSTDTLYLIVNNLNSGSSLTGQFAQGSSITVGAETFTVLYGANYDAAGAFISQTGGNDVALLLAVPEPGTWAMLLGGLGMLMGFQRSTRRGK